MNKMGLCVIALASVGAGIAVACSNGPSCSAPGGAVSGTLDTHCTDTDGGAIVQTVNQASCAAGGDGGASGGYGPTMDNASADDDDCKYHVAWTSSAVCEKDGVVFTVVATSKTDGSPVTGADMEAEIFLSPTHPSPTPFVHSKEGPQGTYVTDPAKFDAPGQWTVRFHLFENCSDNLDDSPHGHAAFFVSVP